MVAQQADFTGSAPSFLWLPIQYLHVDPRYQRVMKEDNLQRFTKNFDFNAIGAIWTSKRTDTFYAIIDGQHRVETIRRVFGEDAEAPCLVYENLTDEEEAALFVLAQNRVHLAPGQAFRADLYAGNPEAIAIRDMVESFGFSITPSVVDSKADGVIMAVSALRGAYRQGPEVLADILLILSEVWQGERRSLQQDFIRGIAAFVVRYRGEFDMGRLIAKLKPLSPHNVVRRADIYKAESSAKAPVAFGRALMQIYNTNMREAFRLDEWFSLSPEAIRGRERRNALRSRIEARNAKMAELEEQIVEEMVRDVEDVDEDQG